MTGKLVSNRLSLETDSQVRQAPDPGFDFSACNGCGLCLTVCPGWRRHHDLRLTAQGFSLAMQHDLAPAWHDLQNCTLCGACDPICPQTTAPVEMIMELRRRHPREQDHADIRNRFGVEMEAVSASNHNSGAIAVPRLVLLPDRELAGRPQLVAGIQSLLGDEATVAGDAGGDIAQAIEAGVTVPEHRWQVFLAAMEGARSVIVADGLLFRAMRSRAPHLPLSTLGETLSSTAGVREELGNSDLYLIESRAYHADFIRLRRYYLELGRERDCNLNLDLQGAAIPTGAVGLWPMEADRQVEWILHGHQVERVVTESLADAEAISRHSDVPVTYIGSL